MEGNKEKPGDRPAGFLAGLRELDRILRGELTRVSSLRRGGIDVSPGRLSLIIVVLGMVYGICMGTFALFRMKQPHAWQMVASMVKIPLLFYLTLLVTLPSLYVFNALVGSRLTLGTVVRLLVASLGVMVAVLASLGPIVAFFSVSTTSYPFMVLFNVVVCSVSGALGLSFLLQTLHRLSILDSQTSRTPTAEGLRAAVEQRLNELESESIPASGSEGPEILGPASARSRSEPRPRQTCQNGIQSLGGRVCPGGRPDGLGLAPVYRQPEHGVHLVPPTRFQLFPGCPPYVAELIFLTRPTSPAS